MANELSIRLIISYDKNGASHTLNLTDTVDVSGNATIRNIRNVATTDESLSKGDVSTIGFVYLHNLDGTNYCSFGTDGSTYPIKLLPGEQAIFRWNSAALHAKANSSATKVEYWMIEA